MNITIMDAGGTKFPCCNSLLTFLCIIQRRSDCIPNRITEVTPSPFNTDHSEARIIVCINNNDIKIPALLEHGAAARRRQDRRQSHQRDAKRRSGRQGALPTAPADNGAARGAAPAARRWDVSQDGGAPGHGAAGSQPGAAAHRSAAAHPQLPRLPGSDEVKAWPGAPREPPGRAAGGKEGRKEGRPAEPGLGGRRGRCGRRSPTQRRAAARQSAGGVRSLPRPRRPRAVLQGRKAAAVSAVSGREKWPAGSRGERGGPPASAGAAGGRRWPPVHNFWLC